MHYRSIKEHLRPYEMFGRRRTTINHAFASAVAPSDTFDDRVVRAAVEALGQDPDAPLVCAYCGLPAETWDHVFATVRGSQFSGHGHRLGNLLPCCKPCNSKKGNKDWVVHLGSLPMSAETREQRRQVIAGYLDRFRVVDAVDADNPDQQALDQIRQQVLDLLAEGDKIAARIRASRPR
jgi:hypothetical protein